jgi:hypothetical protein
METGEDIEGMNNPLSSGDAFVEFKYSTKPAATTKTVAVTLKDNRLFFAIRNSSASLLSIQKSDFGIAGAALKPLTYISFR